MMSYSIK